MTHQHSLIAHATDLNRGPAASGVAPIAIPWVLGFREFFRRRKFWVDISPLFTSESYLNTAMWISDAYIEELI